ncbi:MAG: AAA family ATPase [Chloroflexi bacterium]|nr:MAG: AAA family ATPase [Chloroflexota bacterium]
MNPLDTFGEHLFSKFVARTPGLLVSCEEVEYALPHLWDAYARFFAMYKDKVAKDSGLVEPRLWLWNMHRGLRQVTFHENGRLAYGQTVVKNQYDKDADCNTVVLENALTVIYSQLNNQPQSQEACDLYVLAHPKPDLQAKPRAALFLEEVLEMVNMHDGAARLAIIGMVGELPPMLSSFLPILDFPYPDEAAIRKAVSTAAGGMHPRYKKHEEVPGALVNSLAGLNWRSLTTTAREVAVRLSDPAAAINYASDAKVAAVKSIAPFVTLQPTEQMPPPVVGMEVIKERIRELRDVLRNPDIGVMPGYSMLLCGPPGTGKSILTRWMSAELQIPVLQQDTGAVFNALIGSTDERQRQVHAMSRAMGPHIYNMDEVEKQLPDMRGSQSDGGHGSRYLSGELIFRQDAFDNGWPIYFVDTANLDGLDSLPPEFYSRYTEIFYIDYPGEELLAEIFRAHLAKTAGENLDYDCASLAAALMVALAANVENISGEQVKGKRRAVGRDVVMVIKAAQLASAKRGSHIPNEDELENTITDVRDGLVALDSRGVVLARRTERLAEKTATSSVTGRGDLGLMSLNNQE